MYSTSIIELLLRCHCTAFSAGDAANNQTSFLTWRTQPGVEMGCCGITRKKKTLNVSQEHLAQVNSSGIFWIPGSFFRRLPGSQLQGCHGHKAGRKQGRECLEQ